MITVGAGLIARTTIGLLYSSKIYADPVQTQKSTGGKVRKLQAIICGLMTACLFVNSAGAEDTGAIAVDDGTEVITLEPITVTAQKQEEDVQEVPISISVFNDQAIEDSRIQSVLDLADFVPNLFIFQNAVSGANTPSMRGMHAEPHTLSVSTGLYVDGVPILSLAGYEDSVLDIERIEVLRGPQGTLYGKNAEAGVINIITRQPDNEFRGKVSAEGGKYLSTETGDGLGGAFSFNLSGPLLEDRLFAGFSGKYYQQEGFIENVATGDTANDKEHWYGRGHLRWTPMDRLDISFIFSYLEYNNDGPNFGITESGAAMFGMSPDGYRQVSSNIDQYNKSAVNSQALKILYDFNETLTLTSVTSRRVYEDERWADLDFSPMTLFHSAPDQRFEKISQELRLNYAKGRLKWLAGLFYDKDDDDVLVEIVSDYPSMASTTDSKYTGESYAMFTNLTYPLLPDLNVVAGLRYEKQDREMKDNVTGEYGKNSWESVTPKLALEYFFTPSIMSYTGVTKGFRSGGFNVLDVDPKYISYDQEELWSYEIGAKSAFMDNRLIVNGAIYYMDIKDMQVDEATLMGIYTTNAAEASGYGFELDVTAQLRKGLSLMAGFGYNHIEFDSFQDALGDYKGNSPSYAPEYTFNIGTQYRHGSGFYARADLIGYGEMYLDHANEYSRDAYQIFNAKIGYEAERFDVYLYGKNIFDEEYDLAGYSGGFGVLYSEPGKAVLQLTYRL